MYYIYFPYVLLLSIFMGVECVRENHPKWWAVAVLLAPVTFPYFLFKSRKSKGVFLFLIFWATFAPVMVAEFYIYSGQQERLWEESLAPLPPQISQLAKSLQQTTADLDRALVTLNQLSKVSSRIKEVRETLQFIETLKALMAENKASTDQFILFVNLDITTNAGKELTWIHEIGRFYSHRKVRLYEKSLLAYVDDFEALLRYVHDNFYEITQLKIKKNLNNYDEYYLRYRRAFDAHTQFNIQRIEFQNEVLLATPEIQPFLPGEHQTETFRLWE